MKTRLESPFDPVRKAVKPGTWIITAATPSMLARIEANASSRNLDSTIRVATDATPANMPAASDTTSTVANPRPGA